MKVSWGGPGVTKDEQSVTADWTPASKLIDGVVVRDVRHVLRASGAVTEFIRTDWFPEPLRIDQVFQLVLAPGAVSAWHSHEFATDRLFATHGVLKIVLYDLREGSSTHGTLNEFVVGQLRPALIVIPPKIWHGVQNVGEEPAALINMPDRAYRYEDPDHWRLPSDTDSIPYRFDTRLSQAP